MKFHEEVDFLKEVLNGDLTQEAQINVLFEILNNVLDQGAVRARTVKYKLQKYVNSPNVCERAYALEMIASDGKVEILFHLKMKWIILLKIQLIGFQKSWLVNMFRVKLKLR